MSISADVEVVAVLAIGDNMEYIFMLIITLLQINKFYNH